MDNRQKLILALLVVAVILVIGLVWWAHRRNALDTGAPPGAPHDPADELREASGGEYDAQAAEALRISEARDTPQDHARAATILTRNVLAQDGSRDEARVRNTAGEPPRTRAERRRRTRDRARAHYAAALREAPVATNNPLADLVLDFVFNPLLGGEQQVAGFYTADTQLIGGEPFGLFGGVLVEMDDFGGANGDGAGRMLGTWRADAALGRMASAAKEEEVTVRRHVAKEAAKEAGKGAATDVYVDLATTHTNDPENTHDTSVNQCLKAIADRLKADRRGDLPSTESIVAEIKQNAEKLTRDPATGRGRPEMLADALKVIKRTQNGEIAVAVGLKDEEALRLVWARSKDPRNAAQREALQQAIFDALVDSWKNATFRNVGGAPERTIVCVNGRVSRLLGALTLLDFDKQNWEVKTLEQYKNDIFSEAGKIVKGRAQKWAASSDPKRSAVGKGYLATTPQEMAAAGEADEKLEEQFAEETRAAISKMVDRFVENHSGIPSYMVETVRKEAMAAVM